MSIKRKIEKLKIKVIENGDKVKKIQITVSNLSKIIENKNIYVMNFIIENNLGEKIFSEDEDFFIRR